MGCEHWQPKPIPQEISHPLTKRSSRDWKEIQLQNQLLAMTYQRILGELTL